MTRLNVHDQQYSPLANIARQMATTEEFETPHTQTKRHGDGDGDGHMIGNARRCRSLVPGWGTKN
jgi:hypothetical protein